MNCQMNLKQVKFDCKKYFFTHFSPRRAQILYKNLHMLEILCIFAGVFGQGLSVNNEMLK